MKAKRPLGPPMTLGNMRACPLPPPNAPLARLEMLTADQP
jgi:hypothetical protein